VISDGRHTGSVCTDEVAAGVVRASTAAATHMTTKDTTPTVSRNGFSVKTSAKIQTLSTMLTIGSTITMNGCDTPSGPTWSAAWSSSSATMLTTIRT
jgi:hypothetical protein